MGLGRPGMGILCRDSRPVFQSVWIVPGLDLHIPEYEQRMGGGVGEMATKWSSRVKQHLARLLFLSTLIIISPLFLSALIIRHGPTLPRCAICALAFQMVCSGSKPSRDVWPKLGFGTDITLFPLVHYCTCLSSNDFCAFHPPRGQLWDESSSKKFDLKLVGMGK